MAKCGLLPARSSGAGPIRRQLALTVAVLAAVAWLTRVFCASRVPASLAFLGASASGGPGHPRRQLGPRSGRPSLRSQGRSTAPPGSCGEPAVSGCVYQELLREVLPDLIGVTYNTTRVSENRYRSAAQVRSTGIQGLALLTGLGAEQLDADTAEEAARKAVQNAVMAASGTAGKHEPTPEELSLSSVGYGRAMARHWGEVVYSWSPLPVGLLFDFNVQETPSLEPEPTGSQEPHFQMAARVRLPALGSQVFEGAWSRTAEDAEQSAASVMYSNLIGTVWRTARRYEEADFFGDHKARVRGLVIDAALDSIGGNAFSFTIKEVPVAGYQAVVEAYDGPPAEGRGGQEDDGSPVEERVCALRGTVCRTRAEAEVDAANTAYEALVHPLWKTRAKLVGPSAKRSLPRATPGDDWDIIAQWRAERLDAYAPKGEADAASAAAAALSPNLWFGGVCLCCLAVVSLDSWHSHVRGDRHRRSFLGAPVQLQRDSIRPPTAPLVKQLPANGFMDAAGWLERTERFRWTKKGQQAKRRDGTPEGQPAILVLGEMDFSLSLAIARMRDPDAPMLATSHLATYDPGEKEVYPEDSAGRLSFDRRSLPSMGGVLRRNLEALKELGVRVAHGVDATDLEGTMPRVKQKFKYVVFALPRVSLGRGYDPRNTQLLVDFFHSAAPGGALVAPGGSLQVVLLTSQYEGWDVAGAAASAGLILRSRVKLPGKFYTPREVSGEEYDAKGKAEMLSFCLAHSVDTWGDQEQQSAYLSLAGRGSPQDDLHVSWRNLSIPVINQRPLKKKWRSGGTSPRRQQDKSRTVDTFKPVSS